MRSGPHLDLCLAARANTKPPKARPKPIWSGFPHGIAWAVAFHAVKTLVNTIVLLIVVI